MTSLYKENFVSVIVPAIQALSNARQISEVSAIVKQACKKLIGSDGVTFVLKDRTFCYYFDEEAISPLWRGQKFPLQNCISGWVMLNKTPAIIPDIYSDSRIPLDAYRPTFVKSLVMVPVRRQDPLAAIGNYWAQYYVPTDEEVEQLQILADSVSLAMENVQLYHDLKHQIEMLEKTNKGKDEFLMTLSHELLTPLNSILGWSSLLQDPDIDKNELHLGLLAIERNGTKQAALVQELLCATALRLGRVQLKREAVPIADLIQKIIESNRLEAQQKKLELSFRAPPNQLVVSGDKLRLHQAIKHVLSNAIKFTPNDGKVFVTLESEGPCAIITITDSGVGIEGDFLPRIFDGLLQEDGSSTRAHGGLGLGLYIAKSLVDAHHGSLTVTSEGRGKGTTVKAKLPLLSH